MEQAKLPLALEKKQDGHYERVEAVIPKELVDTYILEFCEAFANDNYLYRIGKSSGEVIFESATYGDVAKFAQRIPSAKKLEESIFWENSELREIFTNKLSYHSWIELYQFVSEHYEKEIRQKILEVHRLVPSNEKKSLTTKTYSYEGEEVVFLSFYQACYDDSEIYAVPVDIAIDLCLEDYDGEEVSRWSDLWDKLRSYEVKEELILKAKCIQTYNYD